MRILVTGSAGFIGSHFVDYLLATNGVTRVVGLDCLTYAGNARNLKQAARDPRFEFELGDICDAIRLKGPWDYLFNFAAESHVDRSIGSPMRVVETNVLGTQNLLDYARVARVGKFVQVSTDEVYGSVEPEIDRLAVERGAPRSDIFRTASESAPLNPSSTYSASKAAADHLVLAAHKTHGLPVVITRSTNNYGPRQHPEKMVPVLIRCVLNGEPFPIYGDGLYVREWLHVSDNCAGIWKAAQSEGVYNIGSGERMTNLELVGQLTKAAALVGKWDAKIRPDDEPSLAEWRAPQTQRVPDRPGHDRRYAVDSSRLRGLGWVPAVRDIVTPLAALICWTRANRDWWGKDAAPVAESARLSG